MREIRFRAWDKYRQEFVNPQAYLRLYNHQGNADTAILTPEGSNIVIVQSTGLTDRNGKEIYEGDILRATDGDDDNFSNLSGVVRWGEDILGWDVYRLAYGNNRELTDAYGCRDLWSIADDYEIKVVGNIYKNPELIERKEQ